MGFVVTPEGKNVEQTTYGYIPRGANVEFGPSNRKSFEAGQSVTTQDLIEADYPTSAQAGFTGYADMPGYTQPRAGAPDVSKQTLAAQPSPQQYTPATTSVSQQPRFQTSQAGQPGASAATAGALGATSLAQPGAVGIQATAPGQPGYVNPSQVTGTAQEFGTDAEQFMIQPFMQPFPFQQQQAESAGLVGEFGQAIAGQETLPAMRSRYEQRYFIPELREAFQTGRESLSDVMAQLKGMPEQVAATSRESLMTAGQRANLIGAKSEPLQKIAAQMGENVSRIGQMLTENEQNLNTAMMYDIAQQKKELMPWEWKYDLHKINQAREFSGWTFSNQLELNRLISNQQAGLTWTNAEANRAHELSVMEKNYSNQLDLLEKQYDFGMQYWG